MRSPSVSVIIPVCRSGGLVFQHLRTVARSLAAYDGQKELILCFDRDLGPNDQIQSLAELVPELVLFQAHSSGNLGAPANRLRGIHAARHEILLFTDDDCEVPISWVSSLAKTTASKGAMTGLVKGTLTHGRLASIYTRLEEIIDRYRVEARDEGGSAKFISFPCFGIRRELMPSIPYDVDFTDNVDDFDLACRLRLAGLRIALEPSIVVQTDYPHTLGKVLKRKLRHARGISHNFLSIIARHGKPAWDSLEIGNHHEIIRRWARISLRASVPLHERFIFLVMNLTYAIGLAYYDWHGSRRYNSTRILTADPASLEPNTQRNLSHY